VRTVATNGDTEMIEPGSPFPQEYGLWNLRASPSNMIIALLVAIVRLAGESIRIV
jgi:hypothetical protein